MKYLREVLSRILNGETASEILTGLTPQNKGHVGEALLRILVLCGIHPTDTGSFVVPYNVDTTSRRLKAISGMSERLDILQKGQINSGGGNKIDACWRDGSTICVCSAKTGIVKITSIKELEIPDMLVQFTESGGFKESGIPVSRETVIPYVLVDNKHELLRVAEKSKASNQVSKDNLNPLDIDDLNRMCAVLRERLAGCQSNDFESILSYLLGDVKSSLRTRLHQKLIYTKVMRILESKKKTVLIGALPRSGKTYIGAAIAKHFKKILVITTRPGETRTQWNNVFKKHREFSSYTVIDCNSSSSSDVATLNKKNENLVAVASSQFMKGEENKATLVCLIGLEWDIVLLDEIHEGGSTLLSDKMLDTYLSENTIRIMMTATYTKPVEYYTIPSDCCCFWDLEDVRLMRNWGEPPVFTRLCEKYGLSDVTNARDESYKSGETNASIRACYENAPRLGILTNIMQANLYDELRIATESPDNVYGFSMRSLFMVTKDGKAFQNQKAVDTFLALITGSDKMKHYKKGDMSFFARILRYWKSIGHRNNDEFMTQLWFLPSGVGQLLEHVKEAMISRIQANSVLKHFATLTLDSGMGDISKSVADAVLTAKEEGKKGLILLTGNVGSLGVSLPEVDVAFMLHDKESADMNYQQMMRVLTEMLNKKYGIVVDFNVWRVLSTLNTYATTRCNQAHKASSDRISWCVSHLIDVDPDLFECRESPEVFPQYKIVNELTNQWRKMLEQTGTSLNTLARRHVDLGEDQKELDKIAKYLAGGASKKTELEVNPDQEKLPSGIEQRTDSDEDDDSDNQSEEKEETITKKANLNDILARLIPEIALLSGCKQDLLEAFTVISENPVQTEALQEFLANLYSCNSENTVSVLLHLLNKNYKKLTDAQEIFEVISNRMSVLDNPQELVAFLGQHLKPKELEKKQNGEVFTPPDLIQQKFNQLTLADPQIWSDPSKKFLDPANGIGNYPAIAFHRLMDGLKNAIPNEENRKKHILENMLYMCELNKKNVEVSRKIFDPSGKYKLNLYQGSYFDFDPKKEWGLDKFDVIFGNPPYNAPGVGSTGNTIWQKFVIQSISQLKEKGFLVFVHPNGWRKPNTEKGKFNGLFELMAHENQIHYLSIHGSKEGNNTFKCGTRYDWYILQKQKSFTSTMIRDANNVCSSYDLRNIHWLPNSNINDVHSLLAKDGETKCKIIYDRTAYGADKKDRMSGKKDTVFKYPCIHSTPKKGIRYMYSKYNDRGHFHIPKVIFGESGIHCPVLDEKGEYGITHGAMGIEIRNKEDGEQLLAYLQSETFTQILNACIFSSFRIDWNLFKEFRHEFWKRQDPLIKKDVSFPVAQATNEIQPNFTSMKVSELKQLCKEKKIKGITGKNKEELIKMLTSKE